MPRFSSLSLVTGAGLMLATAGAAHADILVGVPAPFTGPVAWAGEEAERGVQMAVADLNAAGGVLGQEVRMLTVDDYCDGEQAVAAAKKLVTEGADVVIGHLCSGATLPASKVYADAGVLMITYASTNPLITEQGFKNVFRFCGRDDEQGAMAGRYLAERWGGKNIAILHDGDAYGRGLAEETKKALNARGVKEAMFDSLTPGLNDYWDVVEKLQMAKIDVLYYGGYPREAGLLLRQLRERGLDLQFAGGDGMTGEDFGLIAGEAANGTLFTNLLDARHLPRAAKVVAAIRAQGYEPVQTTLLAYGAMQAWAQAVERAGTLRLDAVIDALRSNEFDTIYGRIRFDEKGDAKGYEPFAWYMWVNHDYVPMNKNFVKADVSDTRAWPASE